MRKLRYSVAMSLDGYVAGPNGEYDWILVDPEIDFVAMYAGFSGLVMGRKSYDVFVATGGGEGSGAAHLRLFDDAAGRGAGRDHVRPRCAWRTCAS